MNKKMTCIKCPKGCSLMIEVDGNGQVIKVGGNKCPLGAEYAKQEVEAPMRVFTSTVLTEGLGLKMAPVRTDQPIPKDQILKAMDEVKKLRIKKAIPAGEIIVKNFLGQKAALILTRNVQ